MYTQGTITLTKLKTPGLLTLAINLQEGKQIFIVPIFGIVSTRVMSSTSGFML